MDRKDAINQALGKLDHENDEHWCKDGRPDLNATTGFAHDIDPDFKGSVGRNDISGSFVRNSKADKAKAKKAAKKPAKQASLTDCLALSRKHDKERAKKADNVKDAVNKAVGDALK